MSIKYFYIPSIKPKLSLKESINFLEKNNCIYIEHLRLKKDELRENRFNRKKGISVRNALSIRSEYKIIGYSKTEKSYKIYWVEITLWWYIIFEFLIDDTIRKRRELRSIEETDLETLKNLRKNYEVKIVNITDYCPACKFSILPNDLECRNCGLSFIR